MMLLEALTLATVLFGASQPVLLEFSAEWCGPCRSMTPTVQRLVAEGYPIRQINVDRDQQLAAQYGVQAVPCFILLADGRPVDRVEGATSHARLVQMFEHVRYSPQGSSGGEVPTRPPARSIARQPEAGPSGGPPGALDPRGPVDRGALADVAAPLSPPESRRGEAGTVERAQFATVRLRIDDARGDSFGTGTIIDAHGDEALVLTCGHIFRDSGGKGEITVDLFGPGGPRSIPGQLIHYDLQRDIGFVALRTGGGVEPVRVAPSSYRLRTGEQVFSIGCDEGREPAVRHSRVTAVDKYLGSPNVEVAGQPIEGRSGGGLFCSKGWLIGVCNAADPADDEGIYAALTTIQRQLDLIGQRRIYEPDAATIAGADPTAEQPAPPRWARGSMPSPSELADVPSQGDRPLAEEPAGLDAAERELPRIAPPGPAAPVGSWAETEMICIIRSRGDSLEQSKLVVLDQPSAQLLDQINREARRPSPTPTNLVIRHGQTVNAAPLLLGQAAGPRCLIVRGQSSVR